MNNHYCHEHHDHHCHEHDDHHHDHHCHEHYDQYELLHAADAYSFQISSTPPMKIDDLQEILSSFLETLTNALEENGCKLIGHIKLLAETDAKGTLFISVTSFGEKPKCKGELSGELCNVQLTLNTIVYGITQEHLHQIVEMHIKNHFNL